jgi:signal transduction histidine kinase/ActR/RegA family two-component response regulator
VKWLEWVVGLGRELFESAGRAPARGAELVAVAPLPIVVLRARSHVVIAASEAWRATFGTAHPPPGALLEVFERAARTHESVVVHELHFRRGDPSSIERACKIVIEPLRAGPHRHGLIAACAEVTDDVIARQLDVNPGVLICSGTAAGADFYNASWSTYASVHADSGDWRQLVHPDELAACEGAVERTLQSGDVAECEARLRRGDGVYRWHQLRFSSREGRWYAVAEDVEATHEAQKQRIALLDRLLIALNEAETAHRAKDNFLATVSHELRAPVTTIMLWETVLREHLDDTSLRARALDAIRDSASAQSRLVGDLLDISRAISGKLRLDRRRMMIDGVLRAAVEAALPAATAKQMTIAVEIRPRLGRVLADASRLRQVFDNLLSNAIKFTQPSGSIKVTAARDGASVKVAFTDTGRGIEEQFLRRLFTPFERHEEVLTRSEGGLGLGLAITKQLVGLHDGTLSAESPGPGRGSTFTVWLPLANRRSSTPVPGPPPEPARRLDGRSVLLVDDESRVREALELLLQRAGASVVVASSAEEARLVLTRHVPDLLVCDISMPAEDGYTFVRALRSTDGRASGIPAIALSAYASERDRERAAAAGFDAHLAKPIEAAALIAAIDHLLAAGRPQIA